MTGIVAVFDGQGRWLASRQRLIAVLKTQGWTFHALNCMEQWLEPPTVDQDENDPDPVYSALCRACDPEPTPDFPDDETEELFWNAAPSMEWRPDLQRWDANFRFPDDGDSQPRKQHQH